MKLKWSRTPFRKAGKGDLLNERWLVKGRDRYWSVTDLHTGRTVPSDVNCFFHSMGEARRVAEDLAMEVEP